MGSPSLSELSRAVRGAPQPQLRRNRYATPPSPTAPNRLLRSLAVLTALGLAALLVVFWTKFSKNSDTSSNRATQVFALPSRPKTADGTGQEGMFEVKEQPQEAPVIAIIDDTDYDLKLVMQDASGNEQTEWVPAGSSKDLTIPQGFYQASIEAPDNPAIMQSTGTVDVKSFHHYQANFILAPYNGSNPLLPHRRLTLAPDQPSPLWEGPPIKGWRGSVSEANRGEGTSGPEATPRAIGPPLPPWRGSAKGVPSDREPVVERVG